MTQPVRALIWNEFRHERNKDEVRKLYPHGMHVAIAEGIATQELVVDTTTLEDPDQGITDERLAKTDVLLWWAHVAHKEVTDETAECVHRHVLSGMGLIVLHSGHDSKVFKQVLGTSGSLRWREAGEREILWNLEPSHPILEGIGECIELPHEEMYGERFDIPTPDELLMISSFQGGEVFRSLCTWRRGHGRVVYFRPGHETHPTYHNAEILRVIGNAARWAARRVNLEMTCINPAPKFSVR
ncbi:MAG: ThuA domain-containing protein [Planctomycetaceae bacterium]|nr:ThuA domain-containing protein [Planctomycetaceae bacterium]